jgi:hypothetical protein
MLRSKVLAFGLSIAVVLGVLAATPATAADDPGDTAKDNSVTVSWLPQDQPAQIVAGEATSSRFWVTNTSPAPISVRVEPAIAIPGNDGQLEVQAGEDPRFTSITFVPDHFTLQPDETIEVVSTIISPSDLPAGTYLIPAMVQPDDPVDEGNIQIRRSIVALNTFQLPGPIETDVSATLSIVETPGSLVRQLPFLPTIIVGDAGRAVLGIRSDSSSGIYVYYEAIASVGGFGALTFAGHTEGAPDDLRGMPELYFPGTGRDHPLDWATVPLSAGAVTIGATVSFNPDPQTTGTATATISFLVLSPWWLLVIVVGAAVALVRGGLRVRRALRATQPRGTTQGARARRRAEQLEPPSSVGAIIGTVLLAILGAASGLLADWLVLAGLAVIGVALIIPAAVLLRRGSRAGLQLAFWFCLIGGLLALATAGFVVASELLAWSPAVALAAAAATAGWAIAAIWLSHAAIRAAARRAASQVAAATEMV